MTLLQIAGLLIMGLMIGGCVVVTLFGFVMVKDGDVVPGLIMTGFGVVLAVIVILLAASVLTSPPRPLKPEGCYVLTHERQFSGKTWKTVEVYTSFPCPEAG